MPTLLLCSTARDPGRRPFEAAAARAGVRTQLVSEGDDLPAGAISTSFAAQPQHVRNVLDALSGTPVDGLVAVGDRPAWLAASLAQALELPLHTPDAVLVAGDALLARGRLLAAGLPVPWFVTVPARGTEDLERLSRVRFPCDVRRAHDSPLRPAVRAASYEELMAARERLAAWAEADRPGGSPADDTLIVEGVPEGRAFTLAGTLELGALRVFALFEHVTVDQYGVADQVLVTPARVVAARQHVIAGHIARAALALGLHHGPVEAQCIVDGDEVVVLGVAPRPCDPVLARAIPVISPERARCTLEDALLAQALGRSLDHYGHQAVASGVLRKHASTSGALQAVEGLSQVTAMPWITGVAGGEAGSAVQPPPEGGAVVAVMAQGAQPDDVIATLREAATRLQVRVR